MNKLISTSILSISLLVSACGDSPKEKEKEGAETPKAPEVCVYSYNQDATTVKWTAYKFTEQVGVSGVFDSVYVDNLHEGSSLKDVFATANITIPVSSVNSNNPDRDAKIQKFFFGSLANTETLKGTVSVIEGDEYSGKFKVDFKMNNLSQPVELDYTTSGDTLKIDGILIVDNWNAQVGIENLNKECKDLHTGADGKSILWPEIKIEISTVLNKNCN